MTRRASGDILPLVEVIAAGRVWKSRVFCCCVVTIFSSCVLGAQASMPYCFRQSPTDRVKQAWMPALPGRAALPGDFHCFWASKRHMKAPAEKMYPSKAVDIVGRRLSKALEYCPIPFVTCCPDVRPGL